MDTEIKTPASKLRPRQANYRISNDAYDMIQQEAFDTGWPKVLCIEQAIRMAYGPEGELFMRGRKGGTGAFQVPLLTRFPESLIEALKATAEARRTTVSELIREGARAIADPEAQLRAAVGQKDENKEFGDIWGEIEKYLDEGDRAKIDDIMYGGDIATETDDQTAVRHAKAKVWLLEKRMELLHY